MKYKPNRKCGDCTACCEGHLAANIHGHLMYPGRACHFLDKEKHKCSIYKDRPKEICVKYECAWLSDPDGGIPEWMKPNVSGALISVRKWEDKFYWNVVEVDKPYDPNVLFWILTFCEQRSIPLEIQIGKIMHIKGPPEFQEYLNNKRK